MCGHVEEHLQLRTAGDLRITVDQLLQVTLQQLASLVYKLLGKVTRDLLRRKQVTPYSIVFHQLRGGEGGRREGDKRERERN